MQELISLFNELKTLVAVAATLGVEVPPSLTAALEKLTAVLAQSEFLKPSTIAAVLTDVETALKDADAILNDDDVKKFLSQVLALIENIRKAKNVEAPASVQNVTIPNPV